jgi:G3E family GTPase
MNDQPDPARQGTIPVTVITGFLGSGKTTLLARLLHDPRFAHTAVIINEFGEIGLDHELLEQSRDELVLLSNGCVCCTVRGDLIQTLGKIFEDREKFGIDRVVVETTGLADPAPILHTLMADPVLTQRFTFESLVTTVDAVNGLNTLKAHPVALKQAAIADQIVLTKLDLVDAASLEALKESIRSLNKVAPLHVAHQGEIDPDLLFMAPGAMRGEVQHDLWLRENDWNAAGHKHLDEHDHDHQHDHDDSHAAHDSAIASYSIVRDQPISWAAFQSWLTMISAMRGDDLLRVKGIVNVLEHPDRPIVIHGVQHVFHPPRTLEKWPGNDRRTRLVFITRNIEKDDIDMTLQVFENKKR